MVQMVVRMVLLLLLLLIMMVMMMEVVVTVRMTETGVHRVPWPDDFRLRSVGQNVEDAEGLDAAVIGLSLPLVLLVRVLHLHHLEPLERFEIIVSGTGSGRRAVAAGPTIDVLLLLLHLVVLLVVPKRRDGVAALAGPTARPTVGHPVVAVARVALLVFRHRVARVRSPRAQTVCVVLPRGRRQLVLRVGCHHHQRQRTRTTHGDLVVVVLHVPAAR